MLEMSGGIGKSRKEVVQKRGIKKRGLRWEEGAAKWAEHKGRRRENGRFWTERGDTHEGGERRRDKIDWRKGKIPAGFLTGELWSRARGVTQSRPVGPELLNMVFCSKGRSAAMLDVSAEGAKMVGVGREMTTKHLSTFTRVRCTDHSYIQGEAPPSFKYMN